MVALLKQALVTLGILKAMETESVPPVVNVDTLVAWTGQENCRHNVRVLCDLEGLTVKQKDDLSSTVHCESDYNPSCVHPNIVDGKTASTDYGIAQINDYFHIGTGKDFETIADAMDPEKAIRWMAKQWLAGNGRLWVCKLKNMNVNYSS